MENSGAGAHEAQEAPEARRGPVMIGENADSPQRLPRARTGFDGAIGYNFPLLEGHPAMEAERVNQIAASLADLKHRTTELRRYL
jgi:hypothetical protein